MAFYSYEQLYAGYTKELTKRKQLEEENKLLRNQVDKLNMNYTSLNESYDILSNHYAELKELQEF